MARSSLFVKGGTPRVRKALGDFDALIAEAIKHELEIRRGARGRRRSEEIQSELHSLYANPENWDQTGIINIIYTDEDTGEQVNVGTFQEFTHKRTQARKLCRIEVEADLTFAKREETHDRCYCKGPMVYCPPSPPANQYEKRAIQAYLERTKGPSLRDFLEGIEVKKSPDIDVEKLLRNL